MSPQLSNKHWIVNHLWSKSTSAYPVARFFSQIFDRKNIYYFHGGSSNLQKNNSVNATWWTDRMKNFRKCNQPGRKTLRSKGVVKPQSESSREGIQLWSFGGWPMMLHAYNINQLKSFKLLKYISKSKSNQKKVPLKSKIAKHSTNSSKPLVKSTSLLWKHLLFIRPHAFFWGQKHTWKILLTKPRLVLSGAVLESHGQGEKQTHRMFCQVAFFSLFGVGKGSPISQIIKKKCFFPDFFWQTLSVFLFHFKDV